MDVEILVHISAPTTHKDDERYRSMADAYSEFEPYVPESPGLSRDTEETPNIDASERTSSGTASHSRTELSRPTYNDPPTPAVAESFGSQHAETAESDDFYGSFPSVTSARARENGNTANVSFLLDEDDNTSPSRSRLEQLERIHTRWKRATPKSSTAKGADDVGYRNPKSPTDEAPLFIEDTQLAEQALETQVYDGLLTSYPSDSELSFPVTDHVRENTNPPQSTNQPEPIIVPIEEPYTTSVQHHSLPIELELGSYQTEDDEWHLVEQQINSEQDKHGQRNPEIIENGGNDDQFDFSLLPSEVFSPPPRVSSKKPGRLPSQVTKELEVVRQQNEGRFNPVRRLRELDADERGYWFIDAGSWPPETQYDFWSSLCEHVHQGRFGWGVTLHREHQSLEGNNPLHSEGLGPLRLYCWGEVVEHIWLYIWLCSNGKIVGVKSRWIDAAESPVIQMP